MFTACPQCQQRLKPEWHRCPRCRMSIPRQAAATPEVQNASSGTGSWGWAAILIAGAMATAGVMGSGALSSPPTEPQRLSSSSSASARQAERPQGFGAASTDRTANAYAAADAKRSGSVAYAGGDMSRALEQYEAAVEATPDDAEAQNNLGQLLVRMGRATDAIAHFDAAVTLDGERWSYRFNRARTYGLLNRWKEAVAEYRVAAGLFPDDHATAFNLGLALLRVPDYPEAVRALEHAVAMAPEEAAFLITLGTAYVGAQQTDRARATFEKFLEVAPSDAEVPRVKGLLEAMTAAGQ
jgi:tetratricopeptide (TPR) repeat protein